MPKGTDLQYERETTIVYNEAEDEAQIWSASPSFQRRMEKMGVTPTRTAERERGNVSAWYTVPRKWVVVRKPRTVHLSEERKEQMRQVAKRRFSPPQQSESSGSVTLSQ